ncbi:MAG TPA: amidohydrolase family protein, partial [Solirubrobacteraceae bacterium]|nr:amidohydrolase family protein [Solirubrobacteraceae bacterium]
MSGPVTVFEGGIVRTMDSSRPVAKTLVVEGDRIVALDEDRPGARRVDLDGGCLLPGFTDSHVHFPTWAVTRREPQLHGSRDDVLALVAEAAPRVPPGRWLRGFGWTDL